MKKILIGLVVILVLIVGALFVVPPIIGNSVVKSRIIETVKEATGRDLQIADLSLAVLPSVSVSITGLRLANAEGASVPEMVSLGRVDLDLQLFPLIGKEVIVDRLVISDLAASLEVNEAGVPNWAFEGAADDDEPEAVEVSEWRALALADLRLGDMRLENARLSYRDMTSGQTIEASDVNLAAALPNIAGKLSLTGGLTLNQKTVHINLGVESPQALMTGQPAKLTAAIRSELIELQSDLGLAQRPQPSVDGNATITIGSVGALLAWLEQPLPADQPDPGPVKLAATFKTEGAKVILEEAVVEGEALDLKAHGSFESEGGVNKVVLVLESDVLDIDRYLPPPAPGAAAPEAEKEQAEMGGARREHPLKAIPDEPIDLTLLKQTEADITIAIAGIKAAGYEVGKLAFTAQLAGGKLQADLSELALYGGGVTGTLSLDGSGDALGVDADFKLDKVDLGALTAVAADGEAPVAGVASGSLTASARGVSPRALVQDLKGNLVFKLGKVDVKNAAAGAISGVDLAIDLPGLAQSPSVKGQVVYNKRKVALDVGLDPLDKVLAGETFALTATLDSKLLKLSYDGLVHQQPLPGLDGSLDLDVSSVGQLAAWLGQPLPEGQPDPGPLKIAASLAADGGKMAIKSASITGKAAEVSASGSVDSTGEITRFDGKLDVAKLDLNAYLPPPSEAEAAPVAEEDGAKGWSEEPIDLSPLRSAEGQVQITLASVLYREIEVRNAAATVSLSGGVLKADVTKVHLSPGDVTASVVVDGSSDAAGIDYQVALQGVESKPFLQSFADMDFLSGKLNFEARGRARGANQKQIVESLNGAGAFTFLDGAIEGFDLAGTLRNLGQLGMASDGSKPKTDFTELSGSYTITDGLLQNGDLKMLAPLVRVTGAGQADLPPQTLDYNVEAKLVASLEGQGGTDALAGLPIPVHAYGSWDNLSYDVDYVTMLNAVALDPARLANLPADIAGQATNFGINLPGLGGVLGGAVGGLLGGGEQEQPAAEEVPVPTGEGPTPAQQEEEPIVPDVGKLLRGLFQ